MPFPSLCSKVTPSWGIDGSSPRMGWVWFCWNQTTGGKVLHPAQGDARFPDRGAPGKAQLSSLQSQRQSEHPKIISMESPWWDLQHRDAPSPGRHQEQGSSAKAGQAAPGARGQLRSQPRDVQGDQAPSAARDAALLKGTSSAVLCPPASMAQLWQRGVLLSCT